MRKQEIINTNWLFTKENNELFCKQIIPTAQAEQINLPHTWNAFDGQDGGNDYYRAECWYQKCMDLPEVSVDENLYLEFEGANSIATVYINGDMIGSHAGGYSTFRFDITDYAGETDVLLSVCVDNRDNADVYPRTADYTFYGGIYREVKLLTAQIPYAGTVAVCCFISYLLAGFIQNTWLCLLIAIAILAVALFVMYTYFKKKEAKA